MINNKRWRLVAIIMVMVVATTLLGGCGPRLKADESLKILVKGTLTLDFIDFDKIGITDEQQAQLKKSTLSLFKLQVQQMLLARANVRISDTQAQKLADKLYETQKRSEVSTKLLSEEGKSAVVELSIQPINVEKMSADLEHLVEQKVMGMPPEEVEKQAAAIITDAYLAAMNKAEFRAEPTVIKVNCKLNEKDNQWIPEDDSISFGVKIAQVIWDMKLG